VKPKKPKRKQTRRINKKTAFLAAYVKCADLTASAAAIGINRSEHYRWLRLDPKYVAAFAQADVEATQTLLDRAVNRVMVGRFRPNVFQGRFCYPQEEYVVQVAVPAVEAVEARDWKEPGGGRDAVAAVAAVPEIRAWRDVPGAPPLGVYEQSEALHLALLRARIPAFRASNVELTGKDGGVIEIGIVERLNAARNRLAAAAKKDPPNSTVDLVKTGV
jgi:hypothetical protein